MNLMHYIVQLAEEKDKKLLDFPDEMKSLTNATRYLTLLQWCNKSIRETFVHVVKLFDVKFIPFCAC